MTEKLLQFIWQFQYFNKNELATSTGDILQIIYSGQYNTNQGPDFTDAKIKIEKTTLVGNIELHIKTSDWKKHEHDNDSNYRNVVLHVVWDNDGSEQNLVPILELKERISKILLQRYEGLMKAARFYRLRKYHSCCSGSYLEKLEGEIIGGAVDTKVKGCGGMFKTKPRSLGRDILVVAVPQFWNESKCGRI